MPAGDVTVTTSWTLIKTTTKDTLIANGSVPIRFCVGSNSGVTLGMAPPMDKGEKIIFPAGVSVYGIVSSGTAPVWWTDFAV